MANEAQESATALLNVFAMFKLTPKQVIKIGSLAHLVEMFGVSKETVPDGLQYLLENNLLIREGEHDLHLTELGCERMPDPIALASSARTPNEKYEKIHLRVDDATIAAGDLSQILRPIRLIANIYDGPAEYERSLRRFSQAQRLVFAQNWYNAEVNNGGHDQFYFNSTGIVWRDALEAYKAIGSLGVAGIVQESADLLGGSPSLDRGERQQQMSELAPNFNELDKRFYAESEDDVDRRVMSYIRSRPADFYFDDMVEVPVRE